MSVQNFYLSQLDVSIDASSATFDGIDTVSFDASAGATVDVSYSVLSTLFQFSTDASDIDNIVTTDVLYKVEYTSSTDPLGIDIDTNTVVDVQPIQSGATDNNVTYDYVRFLATELTNTYLGVDLFSNETELRTNLNNTFKNNFNSVLIDLSNNGIEEDTDNSPSEALLKQIISSDPSRLASLSTYNVGGTWHKMPFMLNDKLYFKLTVSPATNQESLTGLNDPLPDRTYKICINGVND